MPVKTLRMIFTNQTLKTVIITVTAPKENITDLEVKTCMLLIIAKNIFDSTGGNLAAIAGAQMVSKSVQDLSVL